MQKLQRAEKINNKSDNLMWLWADNKEEASVTAFKLVDKNQVRNENDFLNGF